MAFSLRLWDGSRASVAAVLDGHHGDQISDMIAGHLPLVFTAAVHACRDVTLALVRNLPAARSL